MRAAVRGSVCVAVCSLIPGSCGELSIYVEWCSACFSVLQCIAVRVAVCVAVCCFIPDSCGELSTISISPVIWERVWVGLFWRTTTHFNTLQHMKESVSRSLLQALFDTSRSLLTHLAYWPNCKTLQDTARHCKALHHTARHCKTLQDTARHCTTLHHIATHCNDTLHPPCRMSPVTHENEAAETRCNVLQHTATHASSAL